MHIPSYIITSGQAAVCAKKFLCYSILFPQSIKHLCVYVGTGNIMYRSNFVTIKVIHTLTKCVLPYTCTKAQVHTFQGSDEACPVGQ